MIGNCDLLIARGKNAYVRESRGREANNAVVSEITTQLGCLTHLDAS